MLDSLSGYVRRLGNFPAVGKWWRSLAIFFALIGPGIIVNHRAGVGQASGCEQVGQDLLVRLVVAVQVEVAPDDHGVSSGPVGDVLPQDREALGAVLAIQ